ncbi:MAG: hypothetical protein QG610_661 [Euryarchaeota archaeon]|nr:hypothetical protein [Euryarchaeota archaeon]
MNGLKDQDDFSESEELPQGPERIAQDNRVLVHCTLYCTLQRSRHKLLFSARYYRSISIFIYRILPLSLNIALYILI